MAKAKQTVKEIKKANPKAVVADKIAGVLSDVYVLAVKAHGYHWNVESPLFPQLHEMFGKQYESLTDAADMLAERIRALGFYVDASMGTFTHNTVIKEAVAKPITAKAMIEDVLASYDKICARLYELEDVADEFDDVGTQDMAVEFLRDMEKTMWMLRSQL